MWVMLISVLVVSSEPAYHRAPIGVSSQLVGSFSTQAQCEAVADANRSKGNPSTYVPFYAVRCIRVY